MTTLYIDSKKVSALYIDGKQVQLGAQVPQYLTIEPLSSATPEASQDAAAAHGNDTAKVETRKVVRAEEGLVLKLGDEVLGTQIWLKDGQIPEGLTEVKAEETEHDLMNEATAMN